MMIKGGWGTEWPLNTCTCKSCRAEVGKIPFAGKRNFAYESDFSFMLALRNIEKSEGFAIRYD
jgi:hypothetical protein